VVKSIGSRFSEKIQANLRQVSDIDQYLDTPPINVSYISKDNWLFEWWNSRQGEYPQMACAARDFLPLPASEVVCERLFSTGRVVETSIKWGNNEVDAFEEFIR
jgi:hypothetical protein